MSNMPSSSGWLLVSVGLAAGLLLGHAAREDVKPRTNPQLRALDADLWVQTSAEYAACCLQTYRLAGERLEQKLATLPKEGLPPAVVMDLDETVLDNSPFQTWLYRQSLKYDQNSWNRWEELCPDQVRLVPGAKEFIDKAERTGVAVLYISNRTTPYQASTVKALAHLGLNTCCIDSRLLLMTTTSNKEPRREEVRKRYRVLMYFGDNLRDCSEEFVARKVAADDVKALREAIAERKRKVEENRDKFGDEWFVLPNPVYGEWQKLAGSDPVEVLNQGTVPR